LMDAPNRATRIGPARLGSARLGSARLDDRCTSLDRHA
jgi:hypothetical protein